MKNTIKKIKDIVENSPYRDELLAGNFGDKYGIPSGIEKIRANFRDCGDLEDYRKSEEGKELDKLFETLESTGIISRNKSKNETLKNNPK